MTRDFVVDWLFPGEKPSASEDMMNLCAWQLGIEDYFEYPNSGNDLRMVRKQYVENRLEPLVMEMLKLAWTRKGIEDTNILILREYYGIHRHRLSKEEIMARYQIESKNELDKIIKRNMEFLRRSAKFTPWKYLIFAAMFLPGPYWRKFKNALRDFVASRTKDCGLDKDTIALQDIVVNLE